MHHATLTSLVKYADRSLIPGSYWLEDHNAAELLWAGRGFGDVTITPGTVDAPIPLDELDPDGDEITVVRVGGFGDLLWLNAVYQKINEIYPHITINHCCFPRYAPVLHGFVKPNNILLYPFAATQYPEQTSGRVWWMENIIEGKPCLHGEHPCDRIAALFGFSPLERKNAYKFRFNEQRSAFKRWPRTKSGGRPRIAVQLGSSGALKTYPHIGQVMAILHGFGCEILAVGEPQKSVSKIPRGVYFAPEQNLSIRESIAMVSHCDAIVAADSVFTHVGAALDIPTVGIYGPFDGESYMTGQRGKYFQGRLKCSPCSWHPRGRPTPPGMPCETSGICNAVADIPPFEIAMAAMNLIGVSPATKTTDK